VGQTRKIAEVQIDCHRYNQRRGIIWNRKSLPTGI